MTSCADGLCGTGDYNGPKPGDPDVTNSVLTATPAFGGVDLSWSYPAVNAHAVAHTLVFRGTDVQPNTALQIAVASGNNYYDKIDSDQQLYYWIQIVSVNGTVGPLIGPASATPKLLIEDMIQRLTSRIDAGLLAESLKGEIDKITLNAQDLLAEIQNRVGGDGALGDLITQLQQGQADAVALIDQERLIRIDGDTALTQQVDTIAAANNQNAVLITEETQARVDADSALGLRVDTVQTASNDNAAAITAETTARTDADTALAQQITTVQTEAGDNLASVQQTLQTDIDTVTGKVNAVWSAKVNVNGMVGGFGLVSDGTEVEAGFDVDTFWIGRTNADKRKPFIVSDGIVYIDEGAINKLTFSKLKDEAGNFLVEDGRVKADYLRVGEASIDNGSVTNAKIGNVIYSNTFNGSIDSGGNITGYGTAGWAIPKNGQAVFNDIYARGDIEASSLKVNTVYTEDIVGGQVSTTYSSTGTVTASVTVVAPAGSQGITIMVFPGVSKTNGAAGGDDSGGGDFVNDAARLSVNGQGVGGTWNFQAGTGATIRGCFIYTIQNPSGTYTISVTRIFFGGAGSVVDLQLAAILSKR